MNDRELSNKLADALEAFTKVYAGQTNNEGEYEDALFDKARELLKLHRAQRDGEMEARMCVACWGKGRIQLHGCTAHCEYCEGTGKTRPLAKGEA